MIQTQWNTAYYTPTPPRTCPPYIAAIEAGIDTSAKLAAHFGVSIQNVMKHMRKLKALDVVEGSKRTRRSGGVENVWSVK